MRRFRLVPDDTRIPLHARRGSRSPGRCSSLLVARPRCLTIGLNYGIDFKGGIVIEVHTPRPGRYRRDARKV